MGEDAPLWVNALAYLMAYGIPSLFLAVGIWMLVKTRRFMENAQQISMTVVDLGENVTHDDGGCRVDYLPVYEYRSMNGEKILARAFDMTAKRPELGDRKMMLVNPNEPEVARLSSLAGYGFAAFCIGIGAPALIAVLLYV